jgi:hypothetical protein
MIIPVKSDDGIIEYEKPDYEVSEIKEIFGDLMNNFYMNESQVVEKNAKKFYYEIECMIVDINKKAN